MVRRPLEERRVNGEIPSIVAAATSLVSRLRERADEIDGRRRFLAIVSTEGFAESRACERSFREGGARRC